MSRVTWVDAAKGVTILLVVLLHAYDALTSRGIEISAWSSINWLLTYIRMPLFFLLAGLFAGKVVQGPAVVLWRDRVGKFLYLSALWSTLQVAFLTAGAAVHGKDLGSRIGLRLRELADAGSVLWFLEALAVFFAIAWFIRRVPGHWQVLGAAVLSAVIIAFGVERAEGRLWLLVFFLVGVVYGQSILATSTGSLMDRLAGIRSLGWLRHIGRNTLPIYLMHMPALYLLDVSAIHAAMLAAHGLAPVLATALATAASLLVYRLTKRIPGLYSLPNWVTKTSGNRKRSPAEA